MNRKLLKLGDKNLKLISLLVFSVLIVHGILGSVPLRLMFNFQALEIILGGMALSLLISFPLASLKETIRVIGASFNRGEIDLETTIGKIYNLSVKIRKDGLLAIEKDIGLEENSFIRDGMILLSDYKSSETIADIMDHDIASRQLENQKPFKVVEMIANIAPALGLVGTLVGMIGLLSQIHRPETIMPNMASALISTLYGSLISNFLAFPIMARIQNFNNKKLLEYRMIREGILLISKEDHPRNVFDKMNVMLREDKRLLYPREKTQGQDLESGDGYYGFEELFR